VDAQAAEQQGGELGPEGLFEPFVGRRVVSVAVVVAKKAGERTRALRGVPVGRLAHLQRYRTLPVRACG
jgi:hypothetical protein